MIVLIYISKMISALGHLLMCLLVVCIHWDNCIFMLFASFKIVLVLLLLCYRNSYISWTITLAQILTCKQYLLFYMQFLLSCQCHLLCRSFNFPLQLIYFLILLLLHLLDHIQENIANQIS